MLPRVLGSLSLGAIGFLLTSSGLLLADEPANKPQSIADLLGSIEAQQPKLPRDHIDPAAIIAQCGREPQKLVAWVRDNVRPAPYEGCLRGPLGVLMDRAGNSLDRSLLLVQMLELSGYDAHIVRAKVSPADMAATFSKVKTPEPSAQDDPDAKQRQQMQQQAKQLAAMILSKTGQLSVAAPAAGTTHYWVQYNDGKSWVDLDPSEINHAQVKPDGEPLALDTKTHWLGKGTADLQHSVKLQLMVERWENGKLVEDPLVSVAFDAARGPLAPATLTFNPVDPKTSKTGARIFTTGAQLRQKLLNETAWCPILADGKAGGRMARMFNDAGIVGDLPKSFDGAAEVGNAARSGFGGFLGGTSGDSGTSAEAPTVLTALVADYQITVPGQPLRHVRRFIFDSIGPEARASTTAIPKPKWTEQQKVDRGAELAGLHDTLVAFASLDQDAYIYRFGQRAVDSKDAATKAEKAKGRVDDATLQKWADGYSLRTLELFAAARDTSMNPGLVVAEPQIYRREIRYVPDPKATDLDAQVISDLAWNRLNSADGAAAVEQGVLDSLQESVVTMHNTPAAPGDNTAALLAEAAKQGIEVVAIRDSSDSHLSAFDGPIRARMLLDLAAKQIVVAAAKPVLVAGQPRAGWWRVDPASGQTVGEMDSGFLQDFVEYNETQEVNGVRITRFYRSRVSDEARGWAENMLQHGSRKNFTSWDQWVNLLRSAQRSLDFTGVLPPGPGL